MSGTSTRPATERLPGRLVRRLVAPRALALAGGAVLTLSYLSTLYHVVDVVGGVAGTGTFLAVVAGAALLAVVLARVFGSVWAVLLAAALLVAGLAVYLLTVPQGMIDLARQLTDTYALLTGLSVLRIVNAGVWSVGFAPAPVFLTTYFLVRRRYAAGTLAGGAALSLLVLTGDVETVTALVGVLGGMAAVGFGRLDHEGANPALRNTVVVVLVATLVVTTSVSLVPGGEARPLIPDRGASTVEGSLTDSEARIQVLGSIRLSPAARFTVTADEGHYWRAGAYDRYTGDGWVRTGETRPYDTQLSRPEAEDVHTVRQTFRAESTVSTMPAAWKPARMERGEDRALVTELGGLQPTRSFDRGEEYRLISLVPETTPEALRTAGTDYPDHVEARYLQLPESTPDRLGRFTANVTAEADSPYETAVAIERWLEENKEYSLDVDRPDGDVASGFVFEMDRGYCTYYASAMVAMLRTQGVPARFVTGYTPGERVDSNRWVVRGLDSHAWVEVYFPDVGWVRFDPTPAEPRTAAERGALQNARANEVEGVDTDETRPETSTTPTPTPSTGGDGTDATPTSGGAETPNGTGNATPAGPGGLNPFGDPVGAGEGGDSGGGPSGETVLYALVLLLGAATALHRLGVAERLYRAVWLRRLPDGRPVEQVAAAEERVEYLLARRYRPRGRDETRRAYVESLAARGVDERAVELFRLGERARYAGRATEADATTARRLLAELRSERSALG